MYILRYLKSCAGIISSMAMINLNLDLVGDIVIDMALFISYNYDKKTGVSKNGNEQP